ncbi:glycosyltransferase [Streptomyces acidiscabies]|uniref:glycosyltransferase n=1 Tax=Streptomyces acidiscabies TaxID=42234 RepID=UPI0030D2CFF5
MRVLHISDHADPLAAPGTGFQGGQNVYVRSLAASLGALGHEVDVATRWASPRLPARERIGAGARVVRLSAGAREPLHRDRFGEVLEEFSDEVDRLFRQGGGYDVVHSHYWYSGRVALDLARRHRTPVVHTHHSLGAVRRAALDRACPPLREESERRIGERADAVVVGCPSEADDLRRLLGTPGERMRLVPPGVDTSVLRPLDRALARRAVGLPADVPVVLFLGRLEPRKGWEELVHAFSRVCRERPTAVLLVVGGCSAAETDPLVRLAGRYGILANLRLCGSVPHDETALYYSCADVTAVPSHYEPFGLVAVESMACGTPVVATRVGGLSWTVADERVGALVPPRDPMSLADALLSVLDRGRDHFHEACLERVTAHFTSATWLNGIREVYRSVQVKRAASTGTPTGP